MQSYSVLNRYEYPDKHKVFKVLDSLSWPAQYCLNGRWVTPYNVTVPFGKSTCVEKIKELVLRILLSPIIILSAVFLTIKLITFPCIWERKKVQAIFNKCNKVKQNIKAQNYDTALQALKGDEKLLHNENIRMAAREAFGQANLKVCTEFWNLGLGWKFEDEKKALKGALNRFFTDPLNHSLDIVDLKAFIKAVFQHTKDTDGCQFGARGILKALLPYEISGSKVAFGEKALLLVFVDEILSTFQELDPPLNRADLFKSTHFDSWFLDQLPSLYEQATDQDRADMADIKATVAHYFKVLQLRKGLLACINKQGVSLQELKKELQLFVDGLGQIFKAPSLADRLTVSAGPNKDSIPLIQHQLEMIQTFVSTFEQSIDGYAALPTPKFPTFEPLYSKLGKERTLDGLAYQISCDVKDLIMLLKDKVVAMRADKVKETMAAKAAKQKGKQPELVPV